MNTFCIIGSTHYWLQHGWSHLQILPWRSYVFIWLWTFLLQVQVRIFVTETYYTQSRGEPDSFCDSDKYGTIWCWWGRMDVAYKLFLVSLSLLGSKSIICFPLWDFNHVRIFKDLISKLLPLANFAIYLSWVNLSNGSNTGCANLHVLDGCIQPNCT